MSEPLFSNTELADFEKDISGNNQKNQEIPSNFLEDVENTEEVGVTPQTEENDTEIPLNNEGNSGNLQQLEGIFEDNFLEDQMAEEQLEEVEEEEEPDEDTPEDTEMDVDDMENPEDYDESEQTEDASSDKVTTKPTKAMNMHLPIAKVKQIMKFDPDVSIVSAEAIFLVSRATELFIQSLARESFVHTQQAKKKTLQKKDIDMALSTVDSLVFLEGALNW